MILQIKRSLQQEELGRLGLEVVSSLEIADAFFLLFCTMPLGPRDCQHRFMSCHGQTLPFPARKVEPVAPSLSGWWRFRAPGRSICPRMAAVSTALGRAFAATAV